MADEDRQYRQNKDGISLRDFREFISTDENCRLYLSAIGSKLAAIDTAAIVTKRADLLKKKADLEAQISQVMVEIDEINNEEEIFKIERGGDADLAKVSSIIPAPSSVVVDNNNEVEDDLNINKEMKSIWT